MPEPVLDEYWFDANGDQYVDLRHAVCEVIVRHDVVGDTLSTLTTVATSHNDECPASPRIRCDRHNGSSIPDTPKHRMELTSAGWVFNRDSQICPECASAMARGDV